MTDKTPTDAQMIPDEQQLREIDRELRFYSAPGANLRTLTPAQIDAFNRDGFISGIQLFSEDEIAEQRDYFDEILAEAMAAGKSSYSINMAHMKYARVYDLISNPRIVSYARDLLGEDVVAWGCHYFCKLPHDGKVVTWHQDASYWPLTPSRTATVWLALDDADRENGCMQFIPGSHLHGHIEWRRSDDDESNVLDQTVDRPEQYGGEPIYIELKAGEASIHSDLLLHGSEANHSDRRRCGVTLRYCAAAVRAHLGWHEKGIVVSGSDPSGHWLNASREDVAGREGEWLRE